MSNDLKIYNFIEFQIKDIIFQILFEYNIHNTN